MLARQELHRVTAMFRSRVSSVGDEEHAENFDRLITSSRWLSVVCVCGAQRDIYTKSTRKVHEKYTNSGGLMRARQVLHRVTAMFCSRVSSVGVRRGECGEF